MAEEEEDHSKQSEQSVLVELAMSQKQGTSTISEQILSDQIRVGFFYEKNTPFIKLNFLTGGFEWQCAPMSF